MNSKLRKTIGLILISPVVLLVVGFAIFAFYVTFMTEPVVLLIVIAWMIFMLLFLYGVGLLIK